MPKCVHSIAPRTLAATAESTRTTSSTSTATPVSRRCSGSRSSSTQRHERGRGRHDCVSELSREVEARAVAAGLRERASAGREHDAPRAKVPRGGLEPEVAVGRLDTADAVARAQLDARGRRLAQQRREHVAGAVRIREELAVGFFVKRDADGAEEADRVGDGKAAQDAPDHGPAAAVEVGVGDRGVGDVAPSAAAHEDLGARPLRAVEEDDRSRRIQTAGEDGGRQAGRAGADDRRVIRDGRLHGTVTPSPPPALRASPSRRRRRGSRRFRAPRSTAGRSPSD